MRQPFVSLIIDNYNYGRFLKQAIDSCLNQSYPNVEVIVVDDGSTDDSHDIIHSYGDRIVPVFKANGGQASAFNAGFLASQSELIVFVDADDYLSHEAVEQVVSVWKPGIAQVQYRLELVDEAGQFIDLFPTAKTKFDSGDVYPILLARGRQQTTVTSGNALSREALSQIMPIPEAEFRISADGYLMTLIPFYGKVASIEQPLGAYRIHGNSWWTRTKGTNQAEKFRKSIAHDFHRYDFLRARANELSYAIAPDLGFRDYNHLTARIASLRMEPDQHPVASDSLTDLGLKGWRSVLRYANVGWKRKLVLSGWFLWVGFMPRYLGTLAVSWLMVPSSRPAGVDRLFKQVRSLSTFSMKPLPKKAA
ncbi:MAG: glycosyltransferase [Drouetiella hepatica Uher 2000/2452]|jgi:glycosyltransferase involved in cell wall biosynthesis|uniref:Glycosyltransferase n=1 Tax=Drouetiella hepatica Uher 2000/2452 TaxID=904376 RepID=A0A951UPJ8_9CYAN|nr:glycosyltransferase [Drouetiella hepatica Uher 2000/2452]